LANTTGAAARDAGAVVRNARRSLCRAGAQALRKLRRLVDDLAVTVENRRVIAQTGSRFDGVMPEGGSRLISLPDGEARPIRKGGAASRSSSATKTQVVDNADGVILDHNVEIGAPPDAPMLAPAIARVIRRTVKTPRAVTADRGHGYRQVDDDLRHLGVAKVVIPRNGQPAAARRAHEHQRPFRRLIKWRTGSEERIGSLKRRYGWDRSRLDGIDGVRNPSAATEY
jgi:transposase, IS5 family